MKIYAGFDCGGSNTRCMLVSEDGVCLGVGKGGPSNYLFCGREVAAKSITDSMEQAFAQAGLENQPVEGIFIASAAVEVFHGQLHEDFFKEVTGCQKIECDSDIAPVWFAGSRFAPAIAMIAGTGAVTYLLKDRTFIKASGWGPQFGDEGSGFDVGIKAIRMTARMADYRVPMDEEFYDAVLAHYGVEKENPRRLLRAVNDGDFRSKAASVSRVIDGLYRAGNQTAKKLFEEAAEELFDSVRAVISQADGAYALVLSGGMLRADSPLYELLMPKAQALSGIIKVELASVEAVRAAAAIALYKNGLDEASERLMKEGTVC